jgi:hypothetical protein
LLGIVPFCPSAAIERCAEHPRSIGTLFSFFSLFPFDFILLILTCALLEPGFQRDKLSTGNRIKVALQ